MAFTSSLGKFLGTLKEASPLRFWALIGAGLTLIPFKVWLIAILTYGLPEHWEQRIWYLGTAFLIETCLGGVIVVALASVKVGVKGPGGFSAEVDGDHDDPPPTPKVTVTTEVKP